MARGLAIVVNADPKGLWEEGYINDTSKPGTHVTIVTNTNPVGGRFFFQAVSRANGSKGPVLILVNDWEQGQIATTAMVSGTGGHKMYWPLPGDELNCIVAESSGTGTSGENLIGDLLAINDSGFLMAGGALATQPYWLLDRSALQTKVTALRWVKYLGSFA